MITDRKEYMAKFRIEHPNYWVEWGIKNREKQRAASARYLAANREKKRLYMVKWHEAHPTRRAEHYVANKDRVSAIVAIWAAGNPERRSAVQARRRSAKFAAVPIDQTA